MDKKDRDDLALCAISAKEHDHISTPGGRPVNSIQLLKLLSKEERRHFSRLPRPTENEIIRTTQIETKLRALGRQSLAVYPATDSISKEIADSAPVCPKNKLYESIRRSLKSAIPDNIHCIDVLRVNSAASASSYVNKKISAQIPLTRKKISMSHHHVSNPFNKVLLDQNDLKTLYTRKITSIEALRREVAAREASNHRQTHYCSDFSRES